MFWLINVVLLLCVLLWCHAEIDSTSQPSISFENCPFSNIDIVIVAKESDFPLLTFLVNSVYNFMPCWGMINIVIDPGDEKKIFAWIQRDPTKITIHQSKVAPELTQYIEKVGYTYQNYITLWADTFARKEAEFILLMDTDSVFAMPVTCAALFDEQHRAYQLAWSMKYAHPQFVDYCKLMVPGSPCERSAMTTFPFTAPVSVFPSMRTAFARQLSGGQTDNLDTAFYNKARDVYIALGNKKHNMDGFSQFVVMGEHMRLQHPDKIAPVFCPAVKLMAENITVIDTLKQDVDTSRCLTFVPLGMHYGWRTANYMGTKQALKRGTNAMYFRQQLGSEFSKYSTKFGPRSIDIIEEVVFEGLCLQDFLRTGQRPGACDAVSVGVVHEELNLYGLDYRPPVEAVLKTFRPETSPVVCNKR